MGKISGAIIDKKSQKPLAGLQIQLWGVDRRLDKPLAAFKTNQQGKFISNISSDYLLTRFGRPPYPKLYLNILKTDQLLHSTKDTLQWDPTQDLADIRIEVEMSALDEKLFSVSGSVQLADGTPFAGARVHAFDRDLRTEKLLGEAITDNDGHYVIRYSALQFGRREKDNADLLIRVFIENESEPAVTSDIVFSAATKVRINLTLPSDQYRGPSEFTRLQDAITPLLGKTPIADLEEDGTHNDISFLGGSTGFPQETGEAFALSHRLAVSAKMQPEFFFGVLRQGSPNTTLPLMRDLKEIFTDEQTSESILRKAERVHDMLVATGSDLIMQSLERSIQMNIIPTGLDLADLKTRWETHRQKHIKEGATGSTQVVNRLVDLAKLSQQKRALFISSYLDKRKFPAFWKELRNSKQFEESEADCLEALFKLSTILDDEPDIVDKVVAAHSVTHPDTLRRLARLDSMDWEKLLSDAQWPGGNSGDAALRRRKAALIATRFEAAYPTAALVGRMEKDESFPYRERLLPFLAQDPDLELLRLNIDHYSEENGIADDLTHLKAVQRVFKLAPNHLATKALLARGIHSAQQIYFLGPDCLRSTLATEGISTVESDKIYARADMTYASTLHLAGELHSLLRGSSIPALSVADEARAQLEKAFPDLKTLFAITSLCECESCRSVLSPAAYLVDVLRFLDERQVLNVAFARRPDIGDLELSCANTNIPLPHIDLVNEILEDMVAVNSSELSGALSAHLRSGKIPVPVRDEFLEKGLPISLDAEIAPDGSQDVWIVRDAEHTYKVERLAGVLRVTISRQTHGSAEELAAQPEYINPAAYEKLKSAVYPMSLPFDLGWEELRAYLGNVNLQRYELMALVENSILVHAVDKAAEFIGLNPKEQDIVTGSQPANWGGLSNLEKVSVLLKETGLTYGQLEELLACRFINSSAPESRIFYQGDSCDTESMTVSNLAGNNDRLNRIQRFLRLWRKLDLTMDELDRLIQCSKLNSGSLDELFLVRLQSARTLQDRLTLTVEELLCFYENMPSAGESSLYQRVFLNQALVEPVDEAFTLAAMGDPQSTQTVLGHADTFKAALKLRTDELSLLVQPTDRLTLDNISHVYRHVLLARKLSVSVAELIASVELMNEPVQNFDPFDSLVKTLEFVEAVQRIHSLGFDAHRLNYLLKHRPHASLLDIPNGATIVTFLAALRSEFETMEAGATPSPDFGTAPTAEEEESAKAKEQAKIEAKIAVVRKMVAAEFGLADEHAAVVLERFNLAASTDPLAMLFVKSELLAKVDNNYTHPINESTLSGIFARLAEAYQLLYKVACLLDATPVAVQDLMWLYPEAGESNTGKVHLLDFCKLPVASNQPVVPFRTFSNWLDWNGFSRLYPFSPYSVLDVLTSPAPTEAGYVSALSAATEWPEAAINQLISISELQFPRDFTRYAFLHRLHRLFQALHAMDLPPADIVHMVRRAPSSEDVARIKKLVRARYDTRQWLEASKVIQNDLRERKRDALVSYLLHQPPVGASWIDSADLYAHLLLDVDMSACMDTTRILQASLSLQQFVQRCQMNLEKEVTADADADQGWLQWSWMKNYRVWEANRRIFLYPENWIEPELRTDKSQFFRELENELMQNEFTHQNAENAYANYLAKLDDVARLDVCGLYFEEATKILHVFARTYDDPHVYFYRRWVEDRYWTPWEKIDADIKSNQLVPLVINRRLYLYWPEFMDKANVSATQKYPEEPGPGETEVETPPPKKHWEIRLAVSEYRNKKWTPKKLSKSFLVIPMDDPIPVPDASGGMTWDYSPKEKDFSFMPIDRQELTRFVPGLMNLLPPELRPMVAQLSAQCLSNLEAGRRCEIQCVRAAMDTGEVADLGKFDLFGCKGVPEAKPNALQLPLYMTFERSSLESAEHAEKKSSSDDSLVAVGVVTPKHKIMDYTPGRFRVRQTFQLSCFDELVLLIQELRRCFPRILGAEKIPQYTVGTFLPFFYEDLQRTFFVQPELLVRDPQDDTLLSNLSGVFCAPEDWDEYFYTDLIELLKELYKKGELVGFVKWYIEGGFRNAPFRYLFRVFYHPHVCFFLKQLYVNGIDGLLLRDVQQLNKNRYPDLRRFDFNETYAPTDVVNDGSYVDLDLPELERHGYPREDVDFTRDGSYSSYNWELFFHAPFLIATRLADNQRFEEALRWFHYIFNPTDASSYASPQRYWITRPFFERSAEEYITQRIDQIMLGIASKKNAELGKCVSEWRENSFDPHLIAKFRTVAYQKAVVMKYLDTLIAWGDYLFRQDTRESLNQAAQLYVLAAQILGRKPMAVPPESPPPVKSFNQIQSELDDFGNAVVELENRLPFWRVGLLREKQGSLLPRLDSLYFCIPNNENLLGYWDTVADRLYKIRNCMNIEGVRRQLALFQPPIDPGLLVRAAAAGVSIETVLGELWVPSPHYRFQVVLQKAMDFCNEVRSLGGALLATLEKRDAEDLALLRATHEIDLLKKVESVKTEQIEEAQQNVAALKGAELAISQRRSYYQGLKDEGFLAKENVAIGLNYASVTLHGIGILLEALSGGLHAIPQVSAGAAGVGGSPFAYVEVGGQQAGSATARIASGLFQGASLLDKTISLLLTLANHDRMEKEWEHQIALAEKELLQVANQIAAAQIRASIATIELANHSKQIEQSRAVHDTLLTKYSNQELYDWISSQISTVYFQAYQLAFDMAKQAERAYRFELGLTDSNFIQFGYWDSLKKGLLAGERLALDLKRLEASYLDKNQRDYEVTKHLSLLMLNPQKLLELRETGTCEFDIPELTFDLDHPGQYMRRIKSVGLTIPCITGPYTGVSAKLTLLKNRIRRNTSTNLGYAYNDQDFNGDRFIHNLVGISSIATSSAQNDHGLFELNFRDERYLPFEGAGVISTWRLELPSEFRQFDYDTISDVILHISYTAREGGDAFKGTVNDEIKETINNWLDEVEKTGAGLPRLFSLRHEFPNAFHKLLNPAAGADQRIEFELGPQHFPHFVSGRTLALAEDDNVTIYLKPKDKKEIPLSVSISINDVDFVLRDPLPNSEMPTASASLSDTDSSLPVGTWTIDAGINGLKKEDLDDFLILITYTIESD